MRRNAAAAVVLLAALLAAAPLTACGGGGRAPGAGTRSTADVLGPAIDPGADRWYIDMDDDVTTLELASRAGARDDHRVPPRLLRGRRDADLVRASMAEIWTDVTPDAEGLRPLNADQRAVYALVWADEQLGTTGFENVVDDPDAAALLHDLPRSARRVDAPAPLAALYAQAFAFARRAQAPGDWTPFNARYKVLQRHRNTAVASVLGRYIARHRGSFSAP